MSRTDQTNIIIPDHDNRIKDILNDFTVKQSKVVIADFDTLIHDAAYTGKNEEGLRNPEYTPEDYYIAEGVLVDNILRVMANVEEYFDISNLYIVVKGKNNFRYKLFNEYKSKRDAPLPIIGHLVNFLKEQYNAVSIDGCEADDVCYTISKKINHQGIILSIDKDFKQIPSIIYNYKKDVWCRISEQEADHFFALQMCMGDPTDGIPGLVKVGPVKAAKIVNPSMSKFQYMKSIYKAYRDCYKQEGKEKMRMMYNLLRLHDTNNLPKIQELCSK